MHSPSGINMASTSEAGASGVKEKRSRKRKRGGILGFTSPSCSTPAIISQAPRGINAAEFAEARALEINSMVEAIKEADSLSGKRLFQTLPKHMRRRAMSHNIKRIPSRLRQRASFEMNKQDHKTSEVPKKKSRRYRRKPKNLMEEYTRRQREHVWLETHIWHAKRMKMIDAWGYRLADHPNDKGFRAAYRAVKNNCMLQDISYYGCIEVCGAKSQIIQAMGHLTSQEAGLTFAAKYYLNGTRQGNAVLYKFDQYPQGAIGPVSFLWRQRKSSDTEANVDTSQLEIEEGTVKMKKNTFDSHCDISQLWIWSHPASFNSVFNSITEACSYVESCVVETDSKFPGAAKMNSNVNSDQPNGDNIQLLNGIEHCEIKVVSRRFDLLCFRLTGPQSHAVLTSAITPAFDSSKKTPPEKIVNQDSGALCNDKNLNISLKWWQRLQGSSTKLSSQNELWSRLKQASSPSVLPPGCVFGLTVLDPRLNLPVKKISIRSVAEGIHSDNSDSGDETDFTLDEAVNTLEKTKPAPFEQILSHWPNDVANSPIWDASVRLEVKESKIPEQELNRKRSELLVPGSRLKLSENEISHIPLLLIQRPGCSDNDRGTLINNGYGSGWDIILPSGWAMAFWIALVYRGARTGGLQESQTSALELGVPFFPNDFPDTPAGEAYNIKLKDDGEAQYKRYPPSKRPNYERLGVKSPFSPPWRELVKDWHSLNKPSTVAGELSNKTSDSTRIDPSVSDSAQMDVSVVQTLQLSSSLTDDSIVNPETDITSSDSPQGVSSDQSLVKSSLSKDAQTRITCDSTKTTGIENNSNQTTGKTVQPFYVLRSRTKLSALRCYALRHKQKRMTDAKQSKATNNPSKPLDESKLSSIVVSDFNSLVCVQLQMVQRSVPVPNSSVVIPSSEDISKLQKCKNFAGPLEPLHKGPKGQLAEKSLRNSCTRETLGFVSSGHYSLSRGCGFGVAFCVLPGLVKLLSTCSTKECIVLVRGPSIQQYRFAYLAIL